MIETEEIYKGVFDNIEDLITIVNDKLEIECINKATHETLIGYSTEDLLNKEVVKFIHPDDRNHFLTGFDNLKMTGRFTIEARIKHKNGNFIWVEISGKPFKNKNKSLKFIVISRPITQRKKAEELSNRKIQQLQTTIDALNEPLFFLDLNHIILQCNKATLEFFNKSSFDQIIGQSCCKLLHDKLRPVDWCPVVRMKKSNQREVSINKIYNKWCEISSDPIYDDENNLIGAIHLISDITTYKMTEKKLKESENKFRVLFDSFPHFIGLMDMDGTLLDCNPAINKFLSKHKREDMIGLNVFQILSMVGKNKELIPKFKSLMRETNSDGKLKSLEFKIHRSLGGYLWLRIEGSSILIGSKKYIQFIIQDVTARRITEEMLKISENKLQDRIKELGCIYRISKLIENPFISEGELAHGIIELIPPAFQYPNLICVQILYKGKVYSSIDFKETEWKLSTSEMINKNEMVLEVYYRKDFAFLNEEYNLIREVIIRLKTCLEERKIQKKLNESEERYRLIYENANDLIRVLNDRFEFEYLNEEVHKRILGYSIEDLIGQTHLPFLHPADRRNAVRSTVRNLKRGEGSYQARFKDKSGIYRWFEFSGTIFYDSNGDKKILSIARDINTRKRAELRLRESEEKYRLMSETAYDLITILNKRFKYEYVNENALQQILGYSKEEMLGRSVLKFVHPDELSLGARALFEGFKRGQGEIEIRYKHKEGHWVWLEVRGKTFVDKDGEVKALLISRDFTERKKAEEKLMESEERYRLISQNADENLFMFDMNLNLIFNDTKVPNILGYSYEEMKKLNLTDYNVPSSLKVALKAYKEELRNERKKLKDPHRIRTFEVEQIHKNGSIVNVETRFTFIRDEHGEAKAILGLSRNITRRKLAEQRLRESEEKYRLISETAYDLIGMLNKRFKYEYVNEQAFLQILGYSNKDLIGKSALKFIHPDEVNHTAKALFEGFKDGEGGAILRFRHKDGHWVWIEAKGKTFFDRDGELKAIVISRDITEQRISEEKLRDSEVKYRGAYNRAKFYKDLFMHDMNNILTVVNSSVDLIPFYLGESEQSKNIRSITKIMQNQIDRGAKLITNVNALSELEETTMEVGSTIVNLLLENSIKFIERSFSERTVQIDFDSNGENFVVIANQLLREAFDNILINGIKYNDNNSVDIRIRIGKENLNNSQFVKMEFIDNGIGVPDERKEMIFKRGNRELKGSKGMGLGLSLVKKIIKNYKGKIWVEDKVEGDYSKGSNFVLLIPEAI
ncbi:MAG: PAS domain S-box protein [Promethearchaeota archaeon]|jgi:PAS domain S-box-containing protein